MLFESTFHIRTFHTDGFGHVNNAKYLEFLEEARWQFAESILLVPELRASNLGFIIMDLRIRFRAPVTEQDTILVTTSLVTLGTASGEVLQTVKIDGADDNRIATKCMSHFILIDRSNGRSVPIDGKIRCILEEVIELEPSKVNQRHK